jgi:hypothetical protein
MEQDRKKFTIAMPALSLAEAEIPRLALVVQPRLEFFCFVFLGNRTRLQQAQQAQRTL